MLEDCGLRARTPTPALEGADALVIVTEWDAFRALDLDRIKPLLEQPVLVDLRNIYRPDDMSGAASPTSSVGRSNGAAHEAAF